MSKLDHSVFLSSVIAAFIISGCSGAGEDESYNRSFSYDSGAASCDISLPPEHLGLDGFYRKYCSFYGVPLVSSADVSNQALIRAWTLADDMIGQNHDYIENIAAHGIVIAIIGKNENVTDIPEYSDLDPDYWNARARGLGATNDRPAVSGAEENLLCLGSEFDRYDGNNIFVHELSHTIHQFGINMIDSSFQGNLDSLYNYASANLRAGNGETPETDNKYYPQAYALENATEYWAEGVVSYYTVTNVYPRTHSELYSVDPNLHNLIEQYLNNRADARISLCP